MGAKLGTGKGGPMADINVTPLVDVVLVLLIIFMVVTPMLSSGIDVKLPPSRTATTTQDVGQHIVVGIREDGAVFLDTTRSSVETIAEDVQREWRRDPTRSVLVKAAESLEYRQVREVTDRIADSGITTLLLAAEKAKED